MIVSTASPALAAVDGREDNAEPPQRLSLDIVIEDEGWSALGDVEAWVMAAAAVAPVPGSRPAAAVLALDTDAAVRRLNRAYRGIDKPTNVLSFPSGDPSGEHLGDIIFARQTVVREAADLGIPVAHHIQHLTVHGLLHLLGYDHETDTDAAAMEALETRLLARLGVPDPYATSDPV
jgi:probable rRNA maturation factor